MEEDEQFDSITIDELAQGMTVSSYLLFLRTAR